MSLYMDSVEIEDRTKLNSRPGRGLNPGPSNCQSEILPTAPTSYALQWLGHSKCSIPEQNCILSDYSHLWEQSEQNVAQEHSN